jgi:hypothetical protein
MKQFINLVDELFGITNLKILAFTSAMAVVFITFVYIVISI